MNLETKKEILSWVKAFVILFIVIPIFLSFIFFNATIKGNSMADTIVESDGFSVFKLSYIFESPQRHDIVAFNYSDNKETIYISRIIGLPEDKVEIKDGKVYINNLSTPLEDSYIKEEMLGSWEPYYIPEDSYFMLGDNRNDSKDSRHWENPFVKKEKILGKAIFKYYPEFKALK